MRRDVEDMFSHLERCINTYSGMIGRQTLFIEKPPTNYADPDSRIVVFRGKRYVVTFTEDHDD